MTFIYSFRHGGVNMYQLVIVEDEENIRECLINLFPWPDIGIQIAKDFSDGKEALDYLLTHSVDLLLTDIKLPIMDGIELAKIISLQRKDINIIFLTAHRNFDYAQQAVKYGVKDFLLKPVKYNELLMTFLKIKEELDAKEKKIGESTSYYDQIINNVKKYVSDQLRTVTLDEAAIAVNLSNGYLSRLFKEKTGRTFTEYVTDMKMERAAILLRDSSYKTYEVADMIGYDNPKNFTRAFKQYYQVTPREFREKGM